ncbi:ATP-binding protein, partial [Desulfobacterales bacterium HSG17]|nr:ATP-binding protein [Desulfobacterales bacterium HSG17]
PKLIRRIAICGYEGEMNVVMHGGEGHLELELFDDRVSLSITDNGPGIEDVDQALEKGFTTASEKFRNMGFGAGMGLPNMKKNSDKFYIESEKMKGTNIRMIYYTSGEGG